ncbi:hypothetical protein Tco_1482488 [Tanacetum coccineum]
METIHVKFDELTAMASKHDSSEPAFQRFIDDSSADSMNTPSKKDLDNLFRPMYDEYFENNAPISLTKAGEFFQDDSIELDGNTLFTPYDALYLSKDESSTALDPSNMHEFHQVQASTHIWTKAHFLEQVISDPSKPMMTQQRLQTDPEIESMQDEIHQFERLDVWKLVPRQEGKNIIAVKWLWKNKSDAKNIVIRNNLVLLRRVTSRKKALSLRNPLLQLLVLKSFECSLLLLQVHQSPRGIFISQSQYAIELLKKHGMDECVSISTPMATERLDADLQGTPTDQTTYRRMIGGLMYLTAIRPDIAFATFVCAGYQARPTVKHLKDVKRIFQYLRQSYNMCYIPSILVIIMVQQQHVADVHPDELCPPNKRYDLLDANKKFDLEHILYCGGGGTPTKKFWHTLKENDSKYKLKFMLDTKELTLTLDDFRTIFHLPQATNNNHNSFVPPPSFSDMVPFYKQVLGFTMELKTSSSFKTTGLLQPWQTLCKIFSKCLTTRVTGWDQPPLQIMQMIFTKIIVSHYMTIFPEISRRARDKYHNLKDDDIMKNIFNSGRHKDKVGMQIPAWMISEEMKQTEHYRMYAEVFGIDVPLTHNEMILQDTLQVSLAEHKSREEQEARENVALVDEHLAFEEIEKMWWNITNIAIPVNVNDEDEEITNEVYELKRREKGKIIEETRNSPIPTPIRSPRIHTNLISSDTEKLQELTDTHTISSSSSPHTKLSKTNRLLSLFKKKPTRFKCYKSFFQELHGYYGYLFAHLRARFMPRKSFDTLADNLHDNQVPVYVAEGLILKRQKAKEETERLIAKAILQERGNIQAQISTQIENAIANVIPSQVDASNSVKRQKTSEYEAYVYGESSSGQVFQEEQAPSTSGNQEQDDDFDFWTDSYALNDDEILTKQVSQDIMEEVSLTIDEAKLRKMADEMLRQRCTSGDEHQYHIDQMKNFLKSDIVWENPEAPALSLINQDLLYLKKGNSGPEKIVLSLHKFPAIIFNDDDIEEQTSGWVNKCVRKFNPYARYGVEHWKNPHVKIFYIRKQKEPGKPKEEIYSNSKIIQVVKTYWELGHEHKFITEIVARRANKYLVSITEPDYKNLNKNDIEDIYLLIMNGKKVNLTAPTITFPGIEEYEMFSIIYEPVHGIIYKYSKKEKRVMRHSEIHKFYDATLNRVLEGLKSYNNDIKYAYVQKDLTKDKAEYLKLFEVRLKHQRQMRRWEMYVNGRPLRLRGERPE